jgi:hypothetical protein
MRRVSRVHPIADDSKCPSCGSVKGWRIEQRTYNKRGLCYCSGPMGRDNCSFPHRVTHPCCDQHPNGYRNQALARGMTQQDIPLEYLGTRMAADADCPF